MSLYDALLGAADLPVYQAVTREAGARWLLVPYSTGDLELLRLDAIEAIGWAAASPNVLALIFPRGQVVLTGENLPALLRAFHTGDVCALHLVDEERTQPPAPGEPIIDTIEWVGKA